MFELRMYMLPIPEAIECMLEIAKDVSRARAVCAGQMVHSHLKVVRLKS